MKLPLCIKNVVSFLGAACLALSLAGCSTKRNNFFTRNYHHLTSYYNVYWNGLQSRLEVDEQLKEKAVENYFEVLPVFKYGSSADTSMISGQTTRMIEKGVKAVKKHSISIRGKEYVKTIDNAYLLMGMGFFYKQDYSKARSIFNFVLSEFPKNPEKYEAMLWIARTYIQEEDYSMAASFLAQVEAQPIQGLMKQTWRDLPLVQADYFIKQGRYGEAEPHLLDGVKRVRNNPDLKSRIYFILGQIAQKDENNERAYTYFKKCLRLNPPLDLVFNARLNMAMCFEEGGKHDRDIIKGLQRMLKDPKNKDYFGRIYYVLGEMSFRQHNEEQAVEYMDLSIAASSGDDSRVLLAAKRMAFYFYERRQFVRSQKYFEIAAKVVGTEDPDYYDIVSRAANLGELVVYYRQLEQSDTLKMVGLMAPREQRKYAEKKAKEYVARQQAVSSPKSSAGMDAATPGTSSWYFYNEQTRNSGLAEFNRKWGRRELEDLWFLSSKPPLAAMRSSSRTQSDEDGDEQEEDAPKIITPADPEYYLAQLPNSDSAFRELDSMIEPALYHIGEIYCDKMGENAEGEHYLKRTIAEYPSSKYVPSACELLCKIYKQSGDMASFKKYADILAQKYKGSEQDQRVNNPDYYSALQGNAGKVEQIYTRTYESFVRHDYAAVLRATSEVERDYPINVYREQFLYLKIMATAHVEGYSKMLELVDGFLNSYPESLLLDRVKAAQKKAKSDLRDGVFSPASDPVTTDAYQNLINFSDSRLKGDFIATETKSIETKSLDSIAAEMEVVPEYEPADPGEKHHILILCSRKLRDPGVMKLRVDGFNGKFYDDSRLTIDILSVEGRESSYVLVVSSFQNLAKASSYRKMILNNDYVFGAIENKVVLEIGERNLEILNQTHDSEAYREFYEKQ